MKKAAAVFIVLIIILGAAGIIWWRQNQERATGRPEDYTVGQEGGGRIVENKKAGLKMQVPENWLVERMEVEEGSMVFYSPGAEGVRPGRIRPPLKKGCVIEVAVGYESMSLDNLKKAIQEAHEGLVIQKDVIETVSLKGEQVLKNIFESTELGLSTNLYFLRQNKFYGVSIAIAKEEEEKCSQEFDKFLETVVID